MLMRRYGSRLQSVELNFDSKALNEIAFRRDHEASLDWDEFESSHTKVQDHTLAAEAEGDVHDEVEQAVLADLEARIDEIMAGIQEGDLVVVENQQGSNYPKTRQATRTVVQEGENRLHFKVHVDPPLHLGIYRPTE